MFIQWLLICTSLITPALYMTTTSRTKLVAGGLGRKHVQVIAFWASQIFRIQRGLILKLDPETQAKMSVKVL